MLKKGYMTQDEALKLLKDITAEIGHSWAEDGLIFLFWTIQQKCEELAERHRELQTEFHSISEMMDSFVVALYKNSIHSDLSEMRYRETIAYRYRSTDYSRPNAEVSGAMRKEIENDGLFYLEHASEKGKSDES